MITISMLCLLLLFFFNPCACAEFHLACIASISVGLGSKERPVNGILPAQNWGESRNKKEGVGEGKKENACRQTPGV